MSLNDILEWITKFWALIRDNGRFSIAGLLLVIVVLAGWIGLSSAGPILVRAQLSDPVIFHYPRIEEFEGIKRYDPEQLQVLIQRKLVFVDRWNLSDDPRTDC